MMIAICVQTVDFITYTLRSNTFQWHAWQSRTTHLSDAYTDLRTKRHRKVHRDDYITAISAVHLRCIKDRTFMCGCYVEIFPLSENIHNENTNK